MCKELSNDEVWERLELLFNLPDARRFLLGKCFNLSNFGVEKDLQGNMSVDFTEVVVKESVIRYLSIHYQRNDISRVYNIDLSNPILDFDLVTDIGLSTEGVVYLCRALSKLVGKSIKYRVKDNSIVDYKEDSLFDLDSFAVRLTTVDYKYSDMLIMSLKGVAIRFHYLRNGDKVEFFVSKGDLSRAKTTLDNLIKRECNAICEGLGLGIYNLIIDHSKN